ncbi:DUF4234 domain-containing protein [Nocardioides dubius]|uniref:DUF4234 domain-containing protein n=1 Tax=Nocardioides dubius TaxID=317019 RepID=A0ABP4EMN9_9ACTN
MTDPTQQPPAWQPQEGAPMSAYPVDPNAQYAPVQPYQQPGTGELGQIRGTGVAILLFIVTLGFYSLYWYYKVHEEMKRHSGQGIGGGVALLLGFFVGFVMVFLTPAEIGNLRERRGLEKKVSGLTGLWNLLPLIGSIVWFVKTNGAINDYWRSQGAQG